ncbi:MAG: EthD domain-containing protein [Dehalococcoidia bacterium]
MRQFVYVLRRKPGMTREQFQQYWREQHGPLVASVAEVMGIKRYIQVHSRIDATRYRDATRGLMDEPYDGVAEIWFDRAAATGSREEQAAADRRLAEDEANFIDFERSSMWTGEEITFVGKAPEM